MYDDNQPIVIRLPIIRPPPVILDEFHQEFLQDSLAVVGGLVDPLKREGQHRHLRNICLGGVRKQQFVQQDVFGGLLAPEDHLWDSGVLVDLFLKHGAEVEDRVGDIKSRPRDHVECRVPKPLVRTVLLQPWSVEMEFHAPFFPLNQVAVQHFLDMRDQLGLLRCKFLKSLTGSQLDQDYQDHLYLQIFHKLYNLTPNMQLVDLRNFKTRKCDSRHHPTLGPSYFNCSDYHSSLDRRRSPFSESKVEIIYSEVYVEDSYSHTMCSNFVEYLFHPKNYKTIQCKYRFNPNYSGGLEYPKPCPHVYCPFLHDNQDVSSLLIYRNLPVVVEEMMHELQGTSDLIAWLEKPKDVGTIYRKDIDEIKANMKKMQAKIVIKPKQQSVPPPKPAAELKKPSTMAHPDKSAPKIPEQNWYTAYSYFQFGEKLPIIEDRHHQFKNFRDIINNSITPIVMKYIAAFLNSQGGVLYIGIDDSSIVNGLELTQHQFDKFLLSIDKEGKFNLNPPLMPQKYSVKRVPVYHHRRTKDLWVIQIKVTPVQKDKKTLTTYNRECFMRMNAATHKLDAMDLIQYLRLNQEDKPSEKDSLREVVKALEKSGASKSPQELTQLKDLLAQLATKLETLLPKPK